MTIRGQTLRTLTAVCRATLSDGTVIEDLILEQGWIIATSREHLGGTFEQRIGFDPRSIESLEIVQFVGGG